MTSEPSSSNASSASSARSQATVRGVGTPAAASSAEARNLSIVCSIASAPLTARTPTAASAWSASTRKTICSSEPRGIAAHDHDVARVERDLARSAPRSRRRSGPPSASPARRRIRARARSARAPAARRASLRSSPGSRRACSRASPTRRPSTLAGCPRPDGAATRRDVRPDRAPARVPPLSAKRLTGRCGAVVGASRQPHGPDVRAMTSRQARTRGSPAVPDSCVRVHTQLPARTGEERCERYCRGTSSMSRIWTARTGRPRSDPRPGRSVGQAEEGPDGKMPATIRIPGGRARLRARGPGPAPRRASSSSRSSTTTRTPTARCCRATATTSSSGW